MSMSGWSVSGIGFFPFTGKNEKEVIMFLKNHDTSVRACMRDKNEAEKLLAAVDSIISEIDSFSSEDDIEKELEARSKIGFDNLPDIIANVINVEQEMLGFEGNPSCGETDAEANILYGRSYPWEMPEKEKHLYREDIEEILMAYAKELGIGPGTVDDQFIEYYG